MSKILLIDDEADILEFLSYNLRKEGYEVFSAIDGISGIEVAKSEKPDLILLDMMMPGMDGVEVCQLLREDKRFTETLIFFLSARSEDYSQLAGFNAGADNYIIKPISLKVLIARIRSVLKRAQNKANISSRFVTETITIDIERRTVFKMGEELLFPKKEFELLAFLMSNQGKVMTRDEIYSRVWGDDIIVNEKTLDVYINKIRNKIGEIHIITYKGVGFRFEP